jgi:hypothetical protein
MNSHLSYDRFMNFYMTYEEFFVIDMPYDLKFVIGMPYDRNEYANTSCSDAPVPLHFPILRCDHHKEAHIRQSRYMSTSAHTYYCCPYNSVSNNISHV